MMWAAPAFGADTGHIGIKPPNADGDGIPNQSDPDFEYGSRNGEQNADGDASQGSDPALTPLGLVRAQDLARTLHFFGIERVYSTPFKRTIETARPTAEHFNLEIQTTPIEENFITGIADTIILDESQVILVVGHSDTTPQLVNQLAGTSMGNIDDDEHDHLFIVTIRNDEGPSLKRIRYGAPSGVAEECS